MSDKKPALVFLFRSDIPEASLRQYGFFQFREWFDVSAYNLSCLINGVLPRESPAGGVLHFASYGKFEEFVEKNAKTAVFVDYIRGRAEIDFSTEKVFRILKKHNARYVAAVGGAVPTSIPMLSRAGRLMSPARVCSFAFRKVVRRLRASRRIYHFPDIIFGCDTEALPSFCEQNGIDYIPTNSWDYDSYLEYLSASGRDTGPVENTAVYIDEALHCAADFMINGLPTVDLKSYFSSLDGFFSAFESQTGMKVLLAAHPKSDPELLKSLLGGRPVYKGKIVELVARSSCVFAHWSTAVSFAVLFDKPLALLNNSALKKTGLDYLLKNMAACLGVPILDLDEEMGKQCLDPTKWPRTGYEAYKDRYIRRKDAPDLPSWRIMADSIVSRYFGGSERA